MRGAEGSGGLGTRLRLQLQSRPSPRRVLRGRRVCGHELGFTSVGKGAESPRNVAGGEPPAGSRLPLQDNPRACRLPAVRVRLAHGGSLQDNGTLRGRFSPTTPPSFQ